jgi:hypothetical protein
MYSYWFGESEHAAHYWEKGDPVIDSCAICGKSQPHPIHIYNPVLIASRVVDKIIVRIFQRKTVQKVDINGTVFLLDDDSGRYRYKVITNERGWRVLLRDDGNRIESMYISELPHDDPIGKREWESLWEYKRCDAPGYQAIIEMIMTDSVGVARSLNK